MKMSLKIGTLLHRSTYRIEQVLGQGSFGITYLATHVALNKKVAIKEFFMKDLNGRSEDGSITGMSDGSLSMDYARKFRKEALNLADLDHPNIVRVTDSFEDNGTFYYVMDYIDGENLNDYIKLHPVSQQEAVGIIRAVANALQYIHEEKHMLHLDLKPGNIMRRSADGHIFLIDFGLSKHYSQDGQPETSTTIGLGTPGYAPVEQGNQAKSGEFRPTIDVYALGATFYKLLTHETPPPASELVSDDELLVNKLNEHNIDSNLSAIVVNAMLPNVKKRIPTARAFANALVTSLSKSNKAEEKEETIAIPYLSGNPNDDFDTAMSYYNKGQYKEAFPILEQLANKGFANAMYMIGVCYTNGEGTSKNYKTAEKWFIKSKNGADDDELKSNAIFFLALIYDEGGYGIAQDKAKATKFCKEAAELGNAGAQFYYGTSLVLGEGVSIDITTGLYWIHKAADQGDEDAISFIKEYEEIDKKEHSQPIQEHEGIWQEFVRQANGSAGIYFESRLGKIMFRSAVLPMIIAIALLSLCAFWKDFQDFIQYSWETLGSSAQSCIQITLIALCFWCIGFCFVYLFARAWHLFKYGD